jgi:hypothetical protein
MSPYREPSSRDEYTEPKEPEEKPHVPWWLWMLFPAFLLLEWLSAMSGDRRDTHFVRLYLAAAGLAFGWYATDWVWAHLHGACHVHR